MGDFFSFGAVFGGFIELARAALERRRERRLAAKLTDDLRKAKS